MLLPRILAPVRAYIPRPSKPSSRALDALRTANASPAIIRAPFVRYASHQSQGRANGAKDGPGKRLGAKKSGGEFVIPGNILFRQRGTSWYPGENCAFGRDHCIYATQPGWVRYYKDPAKHPKRQYIGVALGKEDKLPYSRTEVRRRRLGFVLVDRQPEALAVDTEGGVEGEGEGIQATQQQEQEKPLTARVLTMGNRYAYREANWQIGRAAERAGVTVKEFVPGDRWAAWRKSQARIKANEEKKRLRSGGKKGKPAKKGRGGR